MYILFFHSVLVNMKLEDFCNFFFFFDCLKNTAFTEKGENEDPDGHIAYKLETLLRML